MSNLTDSISMVDLELCEDLDVEDGLYDSTWAGIVDMFSHHETRPEKNGPCYIPVVMKPRDTWIPQYTPDGGTSYRHDKNVDKISMAVFDLDEPNLMEKAESFFRDYDYVVHSTHSYTAKEPYKYRMLVRLEEPIDQENWKKLFNVGAQVLGVDRSCGNMSRLYYYPSHDVNAGIQPFFKFNEGRSLTLSDINQMMSTYNVTVRDTAYDISDSTFADREKQHFSGGQATNSIDYSYETMCRRHKSALSDYVESSSPGNHRFAMRIIAREITMHKQKVDLFSVYQFLFKASRDYGMKPMVEGNTPTEIPGLTISFLDKAGIPGGAIAKNIDKSLNAAIHADLTQKYVFPDKKQMLRNSVTTKAPIPGLAELRKLHLGAMKQYMNDNDITELSKNVLRNEKLSSGSVDVRKSLQFIFYCANGVSESLHGQTMGKKEITELSSYLINRADDIVHETGTSKGMWTAMCKTSAIIAQQKKWNFQTTGAPSRSAPSMEPSI